MKLKFKSPIVSVSWLYEYLNEPNLIILDATINSIGQTQPQKVTKKQIPNAVFFDLKNVFCDATGEFPNTIPRENHFQIQVQNLGIGKDSCVVIYDDLGVYSSPRAWWLFRLFGFENVAVLDGGLPKWMAAGYEVNCEALRVIPQGNFMAKKVDSRVINYVKVHENISTNELCTIDARSTKRFLAKTPEPRKKIKGGHIPGSVNLPYTEVQKCSQMKSKNELVRVFKRVNPTDKRMIFTCGSGITACILALAVEITGSTNYTIYDGSWTEWASIESLPIAKGL